MFGGGLGNFHDDVLTAEPSDMEGKLSLVEEIKNRAKGCIQTKNYPTAIQLYTKAIELLPNDAILYANRSMCHLGMNNGTGALNDANSAIENDSMYVKGYFRKGMALTQLKSYEDAKYAFLQGLELAPGDKSFISELDKLQSKIVNSSTASSTPKATTSTTTTKPVSTTSAPSKPKTPSSNVVVENDSEQFRGYKKTADGRVTTFFNNELDENTKALIGDIAPKKLDLDPTVAIDTNGNGRSVWNSAGTFEERNVTPWGLARLKEILEKIVIHIPGCDEEYINIKSATISGMKMSVSMSVCDVRC